VGIIDVATKSINSLRRLQQQWSGIDSTVSLLVAQLNAALNQISEWISMSLETRPQHHQLIIDLDTSLKSCKILILFIDGHLSRLEWDNNNTLTLESKVKAVLKDRNVLTHTVVRSQNREPFLEPGRVEVSLIELRMIHPRCSA